MNDRPGLVIEVDRPGAPRGGISIDAVIREIAARYRVTIADVKVEHLGDRVAFFVGGREAATVTLWR